MWKINGSTRPKFNCRCDREPPKKDVSHGALFFAFLEIGMLGFGGVTGWVRQVLVEKRQFLDEREFAEWQGVASILPGANTVNLAVLLGGRYGGVRGAGAALAGLLLAPLVVLAGIGCVYERLGSLPEVSAALDWAAAATAGLVVANALKMARAIRADPAALVVAAAVFCAIGLAGLPLAPTLAVGVPASLAVILLATHGR